MIVIGKGESSYFGRYKKSSFLQQTESSEQSTYRSDIKRSVVLINDHNSTSIEVPFMTEKRDISFLLKIEKENRELRSPYIYLQFKTSTEVYLCRKNKEDILVDKFTTFESVIYKYDTQKSRQNNFRFIKRKMLPGLVEIKKYQGAEGVRKKIKKFPDELCVLCPGRQIYWIEPGTKIVSMKKVLKDSL